MKTEASEKIMENNFHVGNPRRQKDLDLKMFLNMQNIYLEI